MSSIYINNANIFKLLNCIFLLVIINGFAVSQENPSTEGEDPIKEALNRQKQEYIGMKLKENEVRELERIHNKYKISERELKIRSKYKSGQKLSLMDRFRLGRSNRKDYVREKKLKQFNKKAVINRQSKEMQQRMKEREKRTKTKYKHNKRKKKRKAFFKLFR